MFSQDVSTSTGDEKLSDVAYEKSKVKKSEIQQELKRYKDHDWAGEYFYGDGLGVNVSLSLAPQNGFVFTWYGCLGLYDLNYGKVEFREGKVILLFTYPNKREGFEGIAPELLPVRWGQRHYLIPSDRIIEFTNAVNAGTEPSTLFGGRSGSFLLRRGDERKKISGQPKLPAEFLSYILAKPLNARITEVGKVDVKKSRRIIHITLNAGEADGLKRGMELFVKKPSRVFDSAKVIEIGEHVSGAVIEQFDVTDPDPVVGWELSTKL